MDFTIELGFGGWFLLISASLIFGAVAQLIGETETGMEWLIDAIAFFVGALFASEFITGWTTIEPVWEGLALVPALVGGVVVGVIVEVATRFMTGGHYVAGHAPV
jgi:uncharacterized membrane protein YeaQ/YmgE (transglycosylase-associated protein family)